MKAETILRPLRVGAAALTLVAMVTGLFLPQEIVALSSFSVGAAVAWLQYAGVVAV